jgi:DNA sulfur modification protein DndB
MTRYGYSFPAIRGIQAGREYYTSMVPMRLLPKLFTYDGEELPAELRAQRTLNRARIPEMARYLLENKSDYVFSAITASIDGDVAFTPAGDDHNFRLGVLNVDMGARFLINDGQHRRAAIEHALRERPEIGDETIAVVFFLDAGLVRSQQMFADLNRHAIRPSKSLGVLYDHRDNQAGLVRGFVLKSTIFKGLVEFERTTLSPRSSKLLTLSSLYFATNELLQAFREEPPERQSAVGLAFWEAVAQNIPEWQAVRERRLSAGEVRRDFIHSHGIVLQALGRVGATLLARHPDDWVTRLEALRTIDWRRDNIKWWEGRAFLAGHISKARQNIILTTNALKKHLGLPLTHEEQQTEDAYLRGHDDNTH